MPGSAGRRYAFEEGLRRAREFFGPEREAHALADLQLGLRLREIGFFPARIQSSAGDEVSQILGRDPLGNLQWNPAKERLVGPAKYLLEGRRNPCRGTVEVEVFLDQSDIEVRYPAPAATAARSQNVGGRPPAADWDALKVALQLEFEKRGDLDPTDKNWSTITHVTKWAVGFLESRGDDPVESTVRTNVSRILRELRQEKQATTRN